MRACTPGSPGSATTWPATSPKPSAWHAASWPICTGPGSAPARSVPPTSRCTRPRSCSASRRSTSACPSTCARSWPASWTVHASRSSRRPTAPSCVRLGVDRGLPGRRGGQQRHPLLPEAQKGAQFIALCNRSDTPILFVQNITGFMVGTRYEQGGIIKDGAKLINAVSNSTVPHLTLMVGASYGAGNYAMAGRAYDPRFVFTWPNHRIAVMGPKQLAGVLSIVRRNAAAAAGRSFDEAADEELRQATESQIEEESTAQYAAGRLWDDGIIDPAGDAHGAGHRPDRRALGAGARARPSSVWCGTDARPTPTRCWWPTGAKSPAASSAVRTTPAARPSPSTRPTTPPAPTWARPTPRCCCPARRSPRRICPRRAGAARQRRRAPTPSHPGYGFLSENPDLAEACAAAGIVWVGPPARGRARHGSQGAGQGAGRCGRRAGPAERRRGDGGDEAARAAAAAVGYPLLVKASAGGGGRGMRLVRGRRRAGRRRGGGAARGGGRLRLGRGLPGALSGAAAPCRGAGDRGHHGTVLHLFDRECSVQRRHQKVVEEAPAVPGARCGPRGRCGMRRSPWRGPSATSGSARSSSWSTPSGFFFLEMNTRLQVEHGVTELVTGLDLVGLQLAVAVGPAAAARPVGGARVGPCGGGPALRRTAAGGLPADARHRGHVRWPEGPGLRTDRAIESGSVVSPAYDSLVAKLMAHGRDRAGSRRPAGAAVRGLELDGLETNRDLLGGRARRRGLPGGAVDMHYLDSRHDLRDAAAARRTHGVGTPPPLPSASPPSGRPPASSRCRHAGWRNVGRALHADELTDAGGTSRCASPVPGAPATSSVEDAWRAVGTAHARTGGSSTWWRRTGCGGATGCGSRRHEADVNGPEGQSSSSYAAEDDADERGGVAGECRAPLPGADHQGAGGGRRRRGRGRRAGGARGHEDGAHVAGQRRRDRGRGALRAGPTGRRARPPGHGGAGMTAPDVLRIGNCSGFFGDRAHAAREMVEGGPIDVLTGDWLAELTMYILHKTRERSGGYARTFLRELEEVLPTCLERGITVVSNAGGLHPEGLAAAVGELARRQGLDGAGRLGLGGRHHAEAVRAAGAGGGVRQPRHRRRPAGGCGCGDGQRLPAGPPHRRRPGGRRAGGGDRPGDRRRPRRRAGAARVRLVRR